jgi:hypothetical protein
VSDDTAYLTGNLPGGPEFSASISRDVIALRVGDRVCLANPQWMTLDQALRSAAALREVVPATRVGEQGN